MMPGGFLKERKKKHKRTPSLSIITKSKIMKFKAFILGLFVFAFAATAHAQHTPSKEKVEQIEKTKPLKYKGDKKMLSRKQAQHKKRVAKQDFHKEKRAAIAKRQAKHKRSAKAQKKQVRYKKYRATKAEMLKERKYKKRKAKSAPRKLAPANYETY